LTKNNEKGFVRKMNKESSQPFLWITTTEALTDFCDRHQDDEYITVDTEFLREKTYWPELCLIQVGTESEDAIIDPLAQDIDLSPLRKLFSNPKVVKVFHAARQDIEIFYQLWQEIPIPLFDTQVAAMVCGFGESIGYQAIVQKILRKHIDKTARFTDWSLRPLQTKQLEYALLDVSYLKQVYLYLKEKSLGKLSWIEEEMAILNSPRTYEINPQEAWKRLRIPTNSRLSLTIAKELARWRETFAQTYNLTRGRILKDDVLIEIALHKPKNLNEIQKLRGVQGVDFKKYGNFIVDVIQKVLALPSCDLVELPYIKISPDVPGAVLEVMRLYLKICSEESGVAARLIASSAELEDFISHKGENSSLSKGWRYEVFGKVALKILEGKVAFLIQDGTLKLIEI
jgi:ribonuclease D